MIDSRSLPEFLTRRTGMVSSCVSFEEISQGMPKFRNWSKARIIGVLQKTRGLAARNGVAKRDVELWKKNLVNLKVTASLSNSAEETLLYFDFDNHMTGKKSEIPKLYSTLKEKIPELGPLFTNERGGGAWLRVNTAQTHSPYCPDQFAYDSFRMKNYKVADVRGRRWNEMVKKIHEWARAELAATDLDIEGVEVHGRVLVTENLIPVEGMCPGLMKPPPSMDYVSDQVVSWYILDARDFTPKVVIKNKTVAFGSNRFRAVLDGMSLPGIRRLASSLDILMPDRPTRLDKNNRFVSDLQFAEILSVLVKTEIQKDGTNPYKVHENQIVALYESGVLEYSWNFEIYKAVRDYLSSKGWIEWESNSYMPSIKDEKGEVLVKGFAMKWEVGEEVCSVVEKFVKVSATFAIGTRPATVATDRGEKNTDANDSQIILTPILLGSGQPLRPQRMYPTEVFANRWEECQREFPALAV